MSEIIEFIKIFDSKLILVGVVLSFYLIVGLLTWSFIKPLKYLGIPTIIAGIFTIILRFILPVIARIMFSDVMIISKVLPALLGPLLETGVVVFVIGIIMLVTNYFITRKLENKNV